jgi:hypothetical protein
MSWTNVKRRIDVQTRLHQWRMNAIADRRRFDFMEALGMAGSRGEVTLTEIEHEFVQRILCDTNEVKPLLHIGDRNICDSLQCKYGARIAGGTA